MTAKNNNCSENGHIWGTEDYCVFCKTEKPSIAKSRIDNALEMIHSYGEMKRDNMADEKRKVNVYKYATEAGQSQHTKKWLGTGVFHQFGIDYEEFENGPGNFTTAIVEMPDGTVENIPVHLIVFIS